MTQPKLVFFGTDAFSVPSLVRLLAEDWPIRAVITKPDSHTGRGRVLTQPAVKRLAEARGIPVYQPARVKELTPMLTQLAPTAGIVVAYGKIFPASVINLFPHGLINVHASLLPAYRGASPIEAALLHGDDRTGVTLMQIDKGMDTGPTFASSTIQLTGAETRPDLYETLAEMGADLLGNRLQAILDGDLVSVPQDNSMSSTAPMILKEHGRLDWHKDARTLSCEIRAYLGWPGSHTAIQGVDVVVTSAHVIDAHGPAGTPYKTPSGELAVYAAKGSLIIDTLKPAGKREMTGPEFLAGHKL